MKLALPPDLPTRLRFRAELTFHRLWLPLRIRGAELGEMLALAEPRPSDRYRRLGSAYILRRVHKALRRPVLMASRPCLREGLLAYRFLRMAGYRPDLVFGVDAASLDGPEPQAHCWIRLDGRDVLNPPDRPMTVVLSHSCAAA